MRVSEGRGKAPAKLNSEDDEKEEEEEEDGLGAESCKKSSTWMTLSVMVATTRPSDQSTNRPFQNWGSVGLSHKFKKL